MWNSKNTGAGFDVLQYLMNDADTNGESSSWIIKELNKAELRSHYYPRLAYVFYRLWELSDSGIFWLDARKVARWLGLSVRESARLMAELSRREHGLCMTVPCFKERPDKALARTWIGGIDPIYAEQESDEAEEIAQARQIIAEQVEGGE